MVADGEEETVVVKGRDDLLDKENKKQARDEGEHEVVELEEQAQLEGLRVLHEVAAAEYYCVVCDDQRAGRSHCSDRRLAIVELELGGVEACDALEEDVEYGPDVEAKRSLDRGDLEVDRLDEIVREGRRVFDDTLGHCGYYGEVNCVEGSAGEGRAQTNCQLWGVLDGDGGGIKGVGVV